MGSSIVTAMPVMDNPVSQHEQCLVTWATAQSGGDPVVLLAGWLPAWLSGWPESDVSACATAVCNCMHILLCCAASTVQSHPVDAKAHLLMSFVECLGNLKNACDIAKLISRMPAAACWSFCCCCRVVLLTLCPRVRQWWLCQAWWAASTSQVGVPGVLLAGVDYMTPGQI